MHPLGQKQIDETRAWLLQWATITTPSPATVVHWQPPMPLLLTGVVFSDPVLVESVSLSGELLISPPEKRRVAVPALYFVRRIFTPGQELRVFLSELTQWTSATLEFSDEALVRWLMTERGER